mgnify:CR=1 FL=1
MECMSIFDFELFLKMSVFYLNCQESIPYIKYGLGGWWYSDNFYGHTGRARGHTNAVYYMPDTGTVFAIMANADYADIDNIFREISTVLYPDHG